MNKIAPLASEMHGDKCNSSSVLTFTLPHFLVPYLKGKVIQFENKVKARITTLLAFGSPPSPAPVPRNAVVIWT